MCVSALFDLLLDCGHFAPAHETLLWCTHYSSPFPAERGTCFVGDLTQMEKKQGVIQFLALVRYQLFWESQSSDNLFI